MMPLQKAVMEAVVKAADIMVGAARVVDTTITAAANIIMEVADITMGTIITIMVRIGAVADGAVAGVIILTTTTQDITLMSIRQHTLTPTITIRPAQATRSTTTLTKIRH